MCVTFIGRSSIKKVANFIEVEMDGEIIYGDTDSTLKKKKKYAKQWNKALLCSEKVCDLFPDPMKIAFEKAIYSKFLILSKKCYMNYQKSMLFLQL